MLDRNSSAYYSSSYNDIETVILTATLVIIIIVSIFGGLIMLYVLYSNDKMWNSTNMLIGNLAFASTSVAVLVMPFHLLTTANRKWTFGEGHYCKLTGFSASLLILVTIFTHTILSIDRYYSVVRPMSRAMTVGRTRFLIIGIWFLASAISIVPFAGISRYEYNPTTLFCGVGFPRRKIDLVYLLTLSGAGFVIPISIMTYAYTRVYQAIKQHTARLLAHAVISTDVLVLHKRMILTVFLSLICFLLCWSTFCALTITATIVKNSSDLPRGLGIAAYWTVYLNSALNPVIICSMSNRFKEGFFEVCKNLRGLLRVSCAKKSLYIEDPSSAKQVSPEMIDVMVQGTYTQKGGFRIDGLEERPPVSICMQPWTIHENGYSENFTVTSSPRCSICTSDA